jgi:hypothetical protein
MNHHVQSLNHKYIGQTQSQRARETERQLILTAYLAQVEPIIVGLIVFWNQQHCVVDVDLDLGRVVPSKVVRHLVGVHAVDPFGHFFGRELVVLFMLLVLLCVGTRINDSSRFVLHHIDYGTREELVQSFPCKSIQSDLQRIEFDHKLCSALERSVQDINRYRCQWHATGSSYKPQYCVDPSGMPNDVQS